MARSNHDGVTEYYVHPSGDDTNPGTSNGTGAFETVQYALEKLGRDLDLQQQQLILNVSGAHDESLLIPEFFGRRSNYGGYKQVIVRGITEDAAIAPASGHAVLGVTDNNTVCFETIGFTAPNTTAVATDAGGMVALKDVWFGNCATLCNAFHHTAKIIFIRDAIDPNSGVIEARGDFDYGFMAGVLGEFYVQPNITLDIKNAPSFTAFAVADGGAVHLGNMAFSGACSGYKAQYNRLGGIIQHESGICALPGDRGVRDYRGSPGIINPVRNGDFQIFDTDPVQSGSSYVEAATGWNLHRNGMATGAYSADVPGIHVCPTERVYGARRVGRTQGNADAADVFLTTVLGPRETVRFAGRQTTISALVRKGADFSAQTTDPAYIRLYYRTDLASFWTAGLECAATISLTSLPKGGPFENLVACCTIPSTAQQIGIQVVFKPTGTAGPADHLDVARITLDDEWSGRRLAAVDRSIEMLRCA